MKKSFSLAAQLTMAIGCFVAILLGSVIALTAFQLSIAFDAVSRADNEQIVAARSNQLGEMIDKLHWEIMLAAFRPEFKENDKQKMIATLKALAAHVSPEVNLTFFAWTDGNYVTSQGTLGNVLDRDYFKAIVLEGKDFFIGDAVIGKTSHVPILQFSAPVKDETGKLLGLFALQVTLDKLSAITGGIKVGQTGYGWIVDRRGIVIAHPVQEAILKLNITEADKTGYRGLDAIGKKIIDGDRGFGDYISPKGLHMTTYYSVVPGSPNWHLGLSLPTAELKKTVNSFMTLLVILLVLGMLVSVFTATVIARSIVRPIKLAAAGFRELAEGEADLTKTLTVHRNDEIGQLVSEFNTFMTRLRKIISSMKDAQAELSGIGDELGKSVGSTTESVSIISANIKSVVVKSSDQVASVETSSSAVHEISKNVEGLENLIEDQAASITEASASIEEMVGNIASMSAMIEKMAEEFTSLSGASEEGKATQAAAAEKIGKIIEQSTSLLEANEVISQIASQTNLLAMNAAIEAAHAGEAGKGFSVVADEIRRLAETSSEQSRSIGNELKKVQVTIDEVIGSSRASEIAFDTVASRIAATNALVHQVRQAMTEQREGSTQILEALRSMNNITTQVRTGSTEMAQGNVMILDAMKNLSDTAGAVRDRMDEMMTGASGIEANAKTVAEIAEGTRTTIGHMEKAIGRFKV